MASKLPSSTLDTNPQEYRAVRSIARVPMLKAKLVKYRHMINQRVFMLCRVFRIHLVYRSHFPVAPHMSMFVLAL